MNELWDTSAEGHRFKVVLRGYDRHQVDAYIRDLASSGRPSPANKINKSGDIDAQLAEFFSGSMPAAEFDVVLRGYDRREVDRYLEEFDR